MLNKDLIGKIMIKVIDEEDNYHNPPAAVFVKSYNKRWNLYRTPEINGNPFNDSTEDQLIEFDYETLRELQLKFEIKRQKYLTSLASENLDKHYVEKIQKKVN